LVRFAGFLCFFVAFLGFFFAILLCLVCHLLIGFANKRFSA